MFGVCEASVYLSEEGTDGRRNPGRRLISEINKVYSSARWFVILTRASRPSRRKVLVANAGPSSPTARVLLLKCTVQRTDERPALFIARLIDAESGPARSGGERFDAVHIAGVALHRRDPEPGATHPQLGGHRPCLHSYARAGRVLFPALEARAPLKPFHAAVPRMNSLTCSKQSLGLDPD